ncbi:hypothetical protein KAU43_01395 [candidate division WOR-3 bacterium]|nr:hypothetical protein [candidate division WOR-3 bacterium]
MEQLIPFYTCRKAWTLAFQQDIGNNPDRIWIVMGRTGIETHIGTSEKYLDENGKEKVKHRGIKFITEFVY